MSSWHVKNRLHKRSGYMRILALEPYYGGSHKAFLDGFSGISRHGWTILTLPAYKWKWRMRHSAVTFAEEVRQQVSNRQMWDLIFCSDMLNLAEFLGLAPAAIRGLPAIAYFHENQFTYPVRFESERDYQFAMTNLTTALAAKSAWFNSTFHKDSFLEALGEFLRRMPDYQPTDAVEKIKAKAAVYPPGIGEIKQRGERKAGPVRILWAARWEHDKGAEDFFEALKILKGKSVDFRLSVVGQQFRDVPEVFEWARKHFNEHIEKWGYQQKRAEYEEALAEADLIVSTAGHEFFGISVVEAIAAGAYPVVPRRLAYPEILGLGEIEGREEFFYNGGPNELAQRLATLAKSTEKGSLWPNECGADKLVERFQWRRLVPVLDKAVEDVPGKFAKVSE